MATYGRTWWGKKWLDIFQDIDYSNRLPAGKNYANKDLVHSIQMQNNVITALVDDGRLRPYKVKIEISKFSQRETDIIRNVISQSPTIVSALLNTTLPEQLFESLRDFGVDLLPSSWHDWVASCSCDDHAMPCKHIAALIYIISSEIDKNPFMIFTIHSCNLDDVIADFKGGKLASVKKIPLFAAEFPLDSQESPTGFNQKILDDMNFAGMEYLELQICGILKNDPLFYDKNFKDIIESAYKHWRKTPYNEHLKKAYGLKLTSQDDDAMTWEQLFLHRYPDVESWEKIEITMNEQHRIVKINHDDVSLFSTKKDLEGQLVQFLADIPYTLLHKLSPDLRFLHMLRQLSVKLVEHAAVIPQILQTKQQQSIIRWIPAMFNERISMIVKDLASTCPSHILLYEKAALPAIEQTQSLLALLTSGSMTSNLPLVIEKCAKDDVIKLFFKHELVTFTDFSQKEIPTVIHQWLSNLYITHKNHQLYVLVQNNQERFNLSLQVALHEKDLPISICQAIALHPSLKLEILSDVNSITSYIPELVASIESDLAVSFSLNDFTPIFLKILPILKIMGITVILPKELQRVLTPMLKLDLQSKKQVSGVQSFLHLDELLDFNWQIAIGDKKFSIAEFKKLLAQSGGFVRLKDQYVLLDEQEMKKLLKQIDTLPTELHNSDLMQAALSGYLGHASVDTDEYVEELLQKLKLYTPVSVPKNLKAQLRPYQERGFHWMIQNITTQFGSILADDMGLGKTLQVIAVILHLKNNKMLQNGRVLIVVPTGLLTNWVKEIERFAPTLQVQVYHGQSRQLQDKFDVMITSFGTVRRDYKELNTISWFLVVVDEAQNIKNPLTDQTQALKSIVCKHKIALSGTPVENRLVEYWSIFDFTNKKYLGTMQQFQNRFVLPIERDRDKDCLENFKKITNPFILRRLKNDKTIIQDLPEKIETNRYCVLTKEQTATYQEIIDVSMEKIAHSDGIERKGLVFSLINSLKQICNHPAQLGKNKKIATIEQSGKMQMLETILDDIDDMAEKALIFTQYTQMGTIMAKLLSDRFKTVVPFLHGGLTRAERDAIVNEFQNGTQTRILIVSLKAGGTGLNLTAANHVIHYDLWWNPAVEAQATDRAYRIGQNRNVMVHRLIVSGTFEERIDAMIQSKKELANLTVESGETWITEMNGDQLKDLVMLRAQD